MPAILDSLFHKVVNTTSIPIGVEGREWWGATKWRDPPIQELFSSQLASIQAIYSSTCHKMQLHQCSVSPASLQCSDSLLAVCLAGQVGAIYRPPEHPWRPDRPMNEASIKADR